MPTIPIRWSDNTKELTQRLREGVNQIEATKASVERMVKALAGDNLVAAAHKWTAAISEMGGVSKIASADAVRAFGTITKAIEALERQGRPVPESMRAIAKELGTVKAAADSSAKSADLWSGALKTATGVLGAFGVSLSVGAVVGFGKSLLKMASDISDLSAATGVSKQALQEFAFVGVKVGVGMDEIGRAVGTLSERLAGGDKSASEAVSKLGLNIDSLLATGPKEAFIQIGDAVGKIQDPMEKNAVAADLFGGKLSRNLIPLLGDLRTEMERVPKTALISDEQLDNADKFGDKINELIIKAKAWTASRVFPVQSLELFMPPNATLEEKAELLRKIGVDSNWAADQLQKLGDINLPAKFIEGVVQGFGAGSATMDAIDAAFRDQASRKQEEAERKLAAAAEKHAAALKELNSVSEGYGKTLAEIGVFTVQSIKQKLDEGIAEGVLQEAFRLTKAQMDVIQESRKIDVKLLELERSATIATADALEKLFQVQDKEIEQLRTLAAVRRLEGARAGQVTVGTLGFEEASPLPFEWVKRLADAEKKRKEFRDGIQDLTQAFSQLAQISGGTLGGMLQGIGQAVGATNLFVTAIDGLAMSAEKGHEKFVKMGLEWIGAWLSMGAAAISTAAILNKAFGLEGPREIVARLGNNSDAFQEFIKQAGGMDAVLRQSGLSAHELNYALFQALNAKTPDEFAKALEGVTEALDTVAAKAVRVKDVFAQITSGELTVAQGAKIIDENWADLLAAGTDTFGFISKELKEIIELDRVMGTQSKEIAAFLKSQGQAAVEGSNAAILSLTKETDALEALIEKTKALVDESKKATEAKDFAKVEKLGRELFKLTEEQEFVKKNLRSSLDDLGMVALGTFGAMVAAGHTFAEALAAAAPGLDQLAKAWELVGDKTENAALSALLLQSKVLKANPTLIQGVSGLAQSFAALSNMGVLNVDTFSAMQRAGMAMYTKVQGEVAKLGGSTKDALLPMQGYLHAAQEAAEELNIPLDQMTQNMIKDSKEAGIWQEKKKSAIELQTAAMDTLVKKIEKLINTLLGIPDVDFDVTQHNRIVNEAANTAYNTAAAGITFHPPGTRPDPNLFVGFIPFGAAEGGIAHASGLEPWSMGASLTAPNSRDTIPMWLSEGETIRTPTQEAGVQAAMAGGGSDRPIDVHVTLNLDGIPIAKNVIRNVKHDKRGIGTELKDVLGLPR